MVSDDPTDCLVEIAELAMDRMNRGQPEPTGPEAFALGQITGIACRVARVHEKLKELEADK